MEKITPQWSKIPLCNISPLCHGISNTGNKDIQSHNGVTEKGFKKTAINGVLKNKNFYNPITYLLSLPKTAIADGSFFKIILIKTKIKTSAQ